MSSFSDDASAWDRRDVTLLRGGPIVMYRRPSVLAEDIAWLVAHAYRIDHFDGSSWDVEETAHAQLASALEFPDYYGHNLNAFNDCLADLKVPDEGGRVLVFTRYDAVATKMPAFASAVLDIIATQSRIHLLFGRRLFALLQSDDPDLQFEPVGATPVLWTPRER